MINYIMKVASKTKEIGLSLFVRVRSLFRRRRTTQANVNQDVEHERNEQLTPVERSFKRACVAIRQVKPSTQQQLQLYGLYKQASEGDCNREQPSALDIIEGEKYKAWKQYEGMPKEQAMLQYIDVVRQFLPNFETEELQRDEQEFENENEQPKQTNSNNTFGVKVSRMTEALGSDQGEILLEDVSTETHNLFALIEKQKISDLQKLLSSLPGEEMQRLIFQTNEQGLTALSFAIDKELQAAFDFLLPIFRQSLNERDKAGLTPLHYAVLIENEEMVKKLLENGADDTVTDNDGQTAADLAEGALQQYFVKQVSNTKQTGGCSQIDGEDSDE